MVKENKISVRDYYQRNKNVVRVRKILKRARDSGSVPSETTMVANKVPMTALLVAFCEWVHNTPDSQLVRKQKHKLDTLRISLRARDVDEEMWDEERRVLAYLRRLIFPGTYK
tara:strand:- start:38 stop:376 length:339 start_codon:yes stop_codon:yes gene_type:complete